MIAAGMRLRRSAVAALASGLLAGPGLAEVVPPQALDDLPAADIVLLGEVHDNPRHHANQARAVAALQPRALVFEMLTPEQARHANGAARQSEDALREALHWQDTGWPDFAQYWPIFAAAPRARIFGAGMPRDRVRDALKGDVAAAFGDAAEQFGLTVALEGDLQSRREALQQDAHCGALPAEALPGLVMGQRLRDAALARAAFDAVRETGGPVAVITGNGHARTDWAVPFLLSRAAPGLRVLSIGQLESGDALPSESGPAPFDMIVVTDPHPRGDPCAAFR